LSAPPIDVSDAGSSEEEAGAAEEDVVSNEEVSASEAVRCDETGVAMLVVAVANPAGTTISVA
jgi:hypothetical protein